MKLSRIAIILTFLFSPVLLSAQKIDNTKLHSSNKIVDRSKGSLDNIAYQFSINADSICEKLNLKGIESEVSTIKLDNAVQHFNHCIDSLNQLFTPDTDYKRKIDSLYTNFFEKTLVPLKQKKDSLNRHVATKIETLESSIKKRTTALDSVIAANGGRVPSDMKKYVSGKMLADNVDLPTLKTPGMNTPEIPGVKSGISAPNTKLPDVKTNIPGVDEVNKATSQLSKAGEVTKEVGEYKEEVNKISKGDIKDLDKVPGELEKQALKIGAVPSIQPKIKDAQATADQLTGFGNQAKDPEALQDEGKAKISKEFVDHLAGHDDEVKAGMDELSKYQRKFRSLPDTRNVPKHTPNAMKGKPFIERLIQGTSFQISRQHPDWVGLDISPYVGYKISGRWRIAAGSTYRIDISTHQPKIRRIDKQYGYRTFTQFKFWKGLAVHLEGEMIKSTIPPYYAKLKNIQDAQSRIWIPRAYVGIARSYRISDHWNGTGQVIYDFLKVKENYHFNKVAVRFGFEYKFKKKKSEPTPVMK